MHYHLYKLPCINNYKSINQKSTLLLPSKTILLLDQTKSIISAELLYNANKKYKKDWSSSNKLRRFWILTPSTIMIPLRKDSWMMIMLQKKRAMKPVSNDNQWKVFPSQSCSKPSLLSTLIQFTISKLHHRVSQKLWSVDPQFSAPILILDLTLTKRKVEGTIQSHKMLTKTCCKATLKGRLILMQNFRVLNKRMRAQILEKECWTVVTFWMEKSKKKRLNPIIVNTMNLKSHQSL